MECKVPEHRKKRELGNRPKKKRMLKTSAECTRETKTRNVFLRFKENNNTTQIKNNKEKSITRESLMLKDKDKKIKKHSKKHREISCRKKWI